MNTYTCSFLPSDWPKIDWLTVECIFQKPKVEANPSQKLLENRSIVVSIYIVTEVLPDTKHRTLLCGLSVTWSAFKVAAYNKMFQPL